MTEIEEDIEYIEEEIADLLLSVRRLRIDCDNLRHETAKIQKRLSSYKYPVLTLPTEIISEIFNHFLPVYPICPPLAGKFSPTQLTHICRQLREIALSTPILWRAISIPYRRGKSWDVGSVEIWLQRSGSCPLSLHMEKPLSPMWSAKEALSTIVPHRARWEYLSLRLRDLSKDFLQIVGPMPLLRDMKVNGDYSRNPPSLPIAFYDAPRLRSLTFENFTSLMIVFPWSRLTSLNLVGIGFAPAHCTAFLQQTVNLVHCKLVLSEAFDDTIYMPPDTRLPHLESLQLVQWFEEEPAATGYLSTFIVPALLRLQVPDEHLQPDPISVLSTFIAKAGCKLQEVRITGERSVRRSVYRGAFPSIPRFLFNKRFLSEYCETSSNEYDNEDDPDWILSSDEEDLE
ncbi:hypothetical protein GGX14DRAFT_699557 [Mycena pura]|uniref:F-box domain-containing protein n=1 Tax=Mycena pura TaxID=153505 RepID=A0AAD6V9Y6_9AGAR|nr:hypothetical protein GGX14DRAFT_699557 [Mycena pura]